MAGEEGFEPSHAGIKIQCLNQLGDSPIKTGAAKEIRTPNILLRRQVFYPAELQPRYYWCAYLGLNQDSNDYESFALPLSYRRTLKLVEYAGEP